MDRPAFRRSHADIGETPRFVVHHRDSIYGRVFRVRIRSLGTRPLVTPTRSPQANAFSERVIGTIRRGCTDHILFRDERHAERVLAEYLACDQTRPHRSLRLQPPDGARHLAPPRPPAGTRMVATPILGGIYQRYGFSATSRAPPTPIERAA